MEFTVNIDKLDLNDVIDWHYDGDGDRVPAGTLADLVATRIVDKLAKDDLWKGLRQRVQTIRDEEIRARLAPSLAEAFEKPITTTNSFGEPSGKTVTMRELIMQEARKFIEQSADRYGSSKKETLLQKTVREAVDVAFRTEISDAVAAVREDVRARFGKSVGDAVSSAVREAMNARV